MKHKIGMINGMKALVLAAALFAAGGFDTVFAAGGSFVNVSPSATPTTSDASCKNVGDLVSDALPKDQWVTSNRANGELTDTLTWTEEVCLSAVEVYFQSNHKTSVPTFTTGAGSSIAFTPRAEEVVSGEYRKIRYDFDTPTSLTVLTCFFPSPGQSQWLTVNRIWAYENQGGSDDPDDPPVAECTLTLDPKGGTVPSATVELPAESLPTPTREGYHFVGWFKDEIDASAPYVRGKYLCGEPLTSATADDKDKILYAKWVKNDVYNHFQGKKVVFLGDSVTTLYGYKATSHQRYTSIQYTEDVCAQWGVTEKNTWWAQLVQALDMNLLSVNAVAGSPVTEKSSPAAGPRSFSCTARIDDLDVNGVPDVLFIFGGINDFNGSGATIDDFDSSADYLTGELDLTSDCFDSFAEGYATLIRRIRHYYPDTEIVIIAPYVAGDDQTQYNKGDQTIIDLCAYFNIPCLDLRNTQLPRWENGVRMAKDSAHPIPAGFTEFANYVLENYAPVDRPDDPPEDDDVFVNPYADIVVSEAVSNLVKTLTWCSLGTSVTDFNDNPIEGRTQGYQFYTMDKLGWSRDKLLNVGHSGSIVGIANDFPKTTPYDIYTIEFGINDWGTGHPVGTISDYRNYLYNDKAVRWHLFASCYRNVIETIRAANPDAIIVLTTPRKGYGFNGTFPDDCDDLTVASRVGNYYSPDAGAQVDGEQTYLEDYAKLIRQIAEEEDLVLCDWYAYAADQDNLAKRSVDVAVHPNDRGYEMMAQMLAPKILQAVAAHVVDPPVTGESVTLNANGGTVASTTVELPAGSLPTPIRDGYHFVGWFEDKTLTSYDFTPGGSYVPGTLLYGMPVTAPNADYADKTLYAKWVKTSVYEHFHGKKVAVYGDSVSTLLGFVPSAESEMFNGGVFYGQSYVDMGINEHTQWWGQLVDALGMQLLEINAIGGSSVGAYAYEYGLERKAMMNYTRMRLLDDAGTPDVIIVAAGINDYNDNTTGFNANADYLTGDLDRVTSICPDFAKAYALMIRRLQDLYPTTEIVALSSFDVGAAAATETGNDCIRKTCALYNVVNIDMRDAFTLNDGSGVNYCPHGIHPGISGFAAIANHFLESYAPIANPAVVPDCGHTWGFGVLTTPATATASGVRTYTCRHCSATKTEEVPYVALSEGTEADITAQAAVKGVYLMPDDRQVPANTVNKQATPLASYNGYLDSPTNLIDGNTDTVYRDWILNDRYVAFTFEQPMVVTSVKLVGVRNMYPNRIQIVDPNNRLLGKTDGGIPWNSAAGEHQCTIVTTERVANTELRLAFDFEYAGKEFQLKEVEIFGYAAGTEPPIDPPDDPVETEIVALRNVAVATAVGTAPTLPAKVAGLKADGTVSGEYDVVWGSSAAPDSEGITTVAGTAQVNGAVMSVTASVRAAVASSGEVKLVNLTASASSATVTAASKYASADALLKSDAPLADNQWADYLANVGNSSSPNTTELTLAWSSPVTVSSVDIYFVNNHMNYQPPDNVKFHNDSGTMSTEIAYTAGDIVDAGTAYAHITYSFSNPQTLSNIRFFATPIDPSNPSNNSKLLLTRRMWVYGPSGAGGTVEPLTTDTLSALQVDGKDVADFSPTTYAYTVEGGNAITSATSEDNMGITILPKHDGSAYVVTFAEDAIATKKYTVALPPSSVKSGFMVIVR